MKLGEIEIHESDRTIIISSQLAIHALHQINLLFYKSTPRLNVLNIIPDLNPISIRESYHLLIDDSNFFV
jgi:hypothetical protein